MQTIDGSQGEGGGQMIRTSLAMSVLTGQPVTLENIRAGRPKPGLARQHLTALNAVAQISDAAVEGDQLKSDKVVFEPRTLRGGDYTFDIGSAGSATLLVQTILPPLLAADQPSRITVIGGTHNPWAPCFEFLDLCYLPLLRKLGLGVHAQLLRHGFHPAGGGRMLFEVEPADQWRSLQLHERGPLVESWCEGRVANLPLHIAEREVQEVKRLAQWPAKRVRAVEVESDGPGNVLLIGMRFEQLCELTIGFGRQGVPAEKVARDAWREMQTYRDSDAAVGSHLADQLMLPMALAAHKGHTCGFTTPPLTQHSLTHLELLQRFLPVRIDSAELEESGNVRIEIVSNLTC